MSYSNLFYHVTNGSIELKYWQEQLLRDYEKKLLEGTSPSPSVPPSSSRKPSTSKSASYTVEMPSACVSDGSGQSWQQSAALSGNVYVHTSPVPSMHNVYVQGNVALDARQIHAHSAPDGTLYAAAGVTATTRLPWEDLLQDRAVKLRAVPKSMGPKSKQQQFVEKHGFKKPRGGKCRDYYGNKFGRDW